MYRSAASRRAVLSAHAWELIRGEYSYQAEFEIGLGLILDGLETLASPGRQE